MSGSRVTKDDKAIVQAMRVWATLTPDEQRNVFEGTAVAIATFGRTKDTGHLVSLAERVNEMVLLESQPGFTESRRTGQGG